jgi:hypothetical protein
MGTGSLSQQDSSQCVALTTDKLPVARLCMGTAIPLLPICAFTAHYRVIHTHTFQSTHQTSSFSKYFWHVTIKGQLPKPWILQTLGMIPWGSRLLSPILILTGVPRGGGGCLGGSNPPEIPKFWKSLAKFPVSWNIHVEQPNQNTSFTHLQIEWNP